MPTFGGVTGRVYYKAWRVPAPRAAAIVFLHGFGEHSGLYHRLGHALNHAGIELWALDEIGHGLTEGDRAAIGSIDDLVQNGRRLAALAEAVEPGRPVWLAGHLLGSVAAAVAAAREPRRYAGLILSGAALSPLDWVLALGDDDAAELALDPADLSSDPFYLDELAYDPLAFTSAAGARTLATVLPPAWDELAGAFGQVTLPVLFVHGSDDPVVPAAHARAWSGRLAGARLAEFAGARHDILNETVHREVAAAITKFVLPAAAGSAAGPAAGSAADRHPAELHQRAQVPAGSHGTGSLERIIVTVTKTSVVPFVLTATGTGTAQHLTAAGDAGHRFSTDAYPAFGGQDAAPSPLFYALGSLTSCNQVTATLVAKDLGIRLGAWSFEVQGDLDTSVLVGGADGNANFDRVTVRATVETDASDEQFATLVAETERRCPVTQLFKRSGVEWDNQWENAPLPGSD